MSADAARDAARANRWDEAFKLLRQAADAGDASARAQRDVLSRCDRQTLLDPPHLVRLHAESAVFACAGFAPPPVCDWLIARAAPNLQPSLVHDAKSGELRTDPIRTATTTGLDTNLITTIMQERAARVCGIPVSHHEPPSIISYEPGQKFDLHYDFLDPRQPGAADELATFGQRTITIVTYLNTEFEDASTDFPRLDLSFRGAKGDAIIFSNVLPDGAPDTKTLHAGWPPRAGRKWVLSQWIRNKPRPPGR